MTVWKEELNKVCIFKILNVDMPKAIGMYGIIKISIFNNAYFRFKMEKGNPTLDTSYFSEDIKEQIPLSPESELYKEVQQLINEYVAKEKNN